MSGLFAISSGFSGDVKDSAGRKHYLKLFIEGLQEDCQADYLGLENALIGSGTTG